MYKFWLSIIFLGKTGNSKGVKEKINIIDYIKVLNYCIAKDSITKVKDNRLGKCWTEIGLIILNNQSTTYWLEKDK